MGRNRALIQLSTPYTPSASAPDNPVRIRMTGRSTTGRPRVFVGRPTCSRGRMSGRYGAARSSNAAPYESKRCSTSSSCSQNSRWDQAGTAYWPRAAESAPSAFSSRCRTTFGSFSVEGAVSTGSRSSTSRPPPGVPANRLSGRSELASESVSLRSKTVNPCRRQNAANALVGRIWFCTNTRGSAPFRPRQANGKQSRRANPRVMKLASYTVAQSRSSF